MQVPAFSQRDREQLVEISSSLLPPKDGIVLMALGVLVDRRLFFVGLGQGEIRHDQPFLSATGRACLERVIEHSREQNPDGVVHFVEIRRFNRVTKRLREVFAAAKQRDAVFFVCADGAIYDEVFAQLKMQARPGLLTQH